MNHQEISIDYIDQSYLKRDKTQLIILPCYDESSGKE
jgi:hypothetical protein